MESSIRELGVAFFKKTQRYSFGKNIQKFNIAVKEKQLLRQSKIILFFTVAYLKPKQLWIKIKKEITLINMLKRS